MKFILLVVFFGIYFKKGIFEKEIHVIGQNFLSVPVYQELTLTVHVNEPFDVIGER